MWFMWKCWSVCGVYRSHQAFDPSGLCGNVGLCVVCNRSHQAFDPSGLCGNVGLCVV